MTDPEDIPTLINVAKIVRQASEAIASLAKQNAELNSRVETLKTEMVDAGLFFQIANQNALLILVKTLEESGAITREHFQANLRMYAEALPMPPATKEMILDMAEMFDSVDKSGEA